MPHHVSLSYLLDARPDSSLITCQRLAIFVTPNLCSDLLRDTRGRPDPDHVQVQLGTSGKNKKIDIFYWIPGNKPSSLQNLVPLQHSSIMQRFMIDDTKFINHCIDKYDRLTPVKGECKV